MSHETSMTLESQRRRLDQLAVEAFQHPAELIDAETCEMCAAEFQDLAAPLVLEAFGKLCAPIFVFLGRAQSDRSAYLRSWVLLYAVNRVDGETIDACAARVGVSPSTLKDLVAAFRRLVPAYRFPHQKSGAHVAKLREAASRTRTSTGRSQLDNPEGGSQLPTKRRG